jgi:hypothetical protein
MDSRDLELTSRDDRPRLLVRLLGPAAFLWVFLCGVGWINSGAKHNHTSAGVWESATWGFVAAAPGVIAALVTFFSLVVRLLRGKASSALGILFSSGAIFGGLLMDLMVWDLYVDRLYPSFFAHGRRLHHKAKILAPRAQPGAGWTGPETIELDITSSDRDGIAAQWRENGSKEHASIAAFAHLTLDLMALGAPAGLVAAAQRAALDEVRHAEACYGLARSIDGREESPAPFPEAQVRRTLASARPIALAQLAVDALADGALNEGIASRILARLTKRAGAAELSLLLAQMAADEARHARDSWDIIVWCLAEGGEVVRGALARAKDTMPEHLGSPLPPAARGGAWEGWGVQGVALEIAEYAVVRRHAQRRLQVMIDAHRTSVATTARAA